PALLNEVQGILDGGPCEVGIESTIVSFAGERPALLRSGGISEEALTKLIGALDIATDASEHPMAPGQLKSHYAPMTSLRLSRPETLVGARERVGLLSLDGKGIDLSQYAAVELLSRTGNLQEAAVNLFAALKRLESAPLDLILAHLVPP